jgi:hypothetical protein
MDSFKLLSDIKSDDKLFMFRSGIPYNGQYEVIRDITYLSLVSHDGLHYVSIGENDLQGMIEKV